MMDAANANAVAGGSSDLPVVTWKMGSTWGDGNIHFTCDERFSELVSQLTDGRFTITNYSGGLAVRSKSAVRLMFSQGTIQCGGDWGGYWSGKDTAFELLSTIDGRLHRPGLLHLDLRRPAAWTAIKEMYGQYNMNYFPLVTNPSESGIRSVPGPSPPSRICRA